MPVDAKPLFRPDVLRAHVQNFSPPPVDLAKLQHWADEISTGRLNRFGEQEILRQFLTDVFEGLLGYRGPVGNTRYTIGFEKHVEVDGKYADAVLGEFNSHQKFVVAVEGKGPRDPLDRPHAGRRMSAVDQGYRYAINLPCDWIIVTSVRQIRLYHKGSDQHTYELFDTERLADDPEAFRRFRFLLGAERVVPVAGRCHFQDLLAESEKVGRELTRKFYIDYADLRQDAFERLSGDNASVPRQAVLSATQKLLDRVLFVAFSEDRGLLPTESIKKAFEHRDPYHPRPIWENFRGLFRSIDRGNAALGISAYNGGLFADDPVLDALQVSDEVCGFFRELGEYDYKPPELATGETKVIDVDILGHIFEQSITDLEKLRHELDGLAQPVGAEKHKTRRKKEGAFYTPAFITRYIVEQALGGVLKERFEALRVRLAASAKGAAKTALDDPRVYVLDKLGKPARAALVKFWETWQDDLKTLRVLDPACGSGAFLIEAFDQLHTAYQHSNDRLLELRGHRSLFDLDKQILEHNLYGVDLNEEAIEICRLSLWIKTAQRGKPLTSLDHTIRVGNSVVADPAVHPRALDWRATFPEVFEQGGFDVVVGNPPYIRQEWLAPYKKYWESCFETYDGVADIFTYFFERGLQILRDGGRLAYITSGSWVKGNFGAPLREYLSKNAGIESMVDFGEFQPFEDAEMIRPTITVVIKSRECPQMRLFKWLVAGSPPENLSEVLADSPTMGTAHLGSKAWDLEPEIVIRLRETLAERGVPLTKYCRGQFFRGAVTGLNEVFVIDDSLRGQLIRQDPTSEEIIKPFLQGTHLRAWHVHHSSQHLIFARRGLDITAFPAILAYLESFRERLEPRPDSWPSGRKWNGRKSGAYKWHELQDAADFWPEFEKPKIVWPDIGNAPRFSIELGKRFIGDTAFAIPVADYFLLGVLNSWTTWFFLSKTAQPLRLRSDRWQYRLKSLYMEHVPIPVAPEKERTAIAHSAKTASRIAADRYELQTRTQQRLTSSLSDNMSREHPGKLNQKAEAWWELSIRELGAELKKSFKLDRNPMLNPRTADEWEPYLAEKRAEVERLSRELADAEAEINDRVFRLFNLTKDEIALLLREVEH